MNVFVLNTGRCGSTTFIRACKHIENYSCAHESRSGMLANDRFNYPDNHIEADNRLSWLLGRLDEKYGDNAIYVHLKRNDDETARSLVRRYYFGMIKAYRRDGVLLGLPEESDSRAVALDYCHTVNSNIELFLKYKTKKIVVDIGNIENDFTSFFEYIGAKGNVKAALAEFNIKYNSSEQLGYIVKPGVIHRLFKKFKRLIVRFPEFIMNV